MSSGGSLISTALAIGSFAGLYLLKQRQQVLPSQQGERSGKHSRRQESQQSFALSLPRHWSSFIDRISERVLHFRPLLMEKLKILVESYGARQIERKASEDSLILGTSNSTANSEEEEERTSERKEEAGYPITSVPSPKRKLKSPSKQDELEPDCDEHTQLRDTSVSITVSVNRNQHGMDHATVQQHHKLSSFSTNNLSSPKTPPGSLPGTPDTVATTPGSFSNGRDHDTDDYTTNSARKAQRRTIFGTHVTTKYVQQSP